MKKYLFLVLLAFTAACASENHHIVSEEKGNIEVSQSESEPQYSSNIFIRRYQQALDAQREATGKEPNFTFKAGIFLPSILMTAILYPFALVKTTAESND